DTQRGRRSNSATQTVALVGYTNAGKSRLMRALTDDAMLVADRLFATLDTTVRILVPETRPRNLISDTVGFIKDLPHDLVASFRSTLEEAKDADLHLHVVDAADPAFRNQYEVTREVLTEIAAADHPCLLILNKSDLLDNRPRSRCCTSVAACSRSGTRRTAPISACARPLRCSVGFAAKSRDPEPEAGAVPRPSRRRRWPPRMAYSNETTQRQGSPLPTKDRGFALVGGEQAGPTAIDWQSLPSHGLTRPPPS
ncbi:MAG: 50S ribosome-binding GTPase, partial [Deltaproteobacteria bacterium]|nr:50S ribosome-binding GTPase [Deltaproteobacteria bacterium]